MGRGREKRGEIMKDYKAIRISINGRPTYGDKYTTIRSEKEYKYNDLVEIRNEKYIILFEME